MPPILALILTLLFISFLFVRDKREGYAPSLVLAIPCIWMVILGSRPIVEWLNAFGFQVAGSEDITEGNPVDRVVIFILMGIGLIVLLKRGISWSQLVRNNMALTLFILYCGISIIWSDFPFVAFKRFIKGVGDPIMVLIILTDRDPLKAAEIVVRVCVNILVPLSVLLMKYYPEIGRSTVDEWTGILSYTGVASNKNMLGLSLMVYGIFLARRLYVKRTEKIEALIAPSLLLAMVGWLFMMADSKTPLLGLGLAVMIFLFLGIRVIRTHLTACVLTVILAGGLLQWAVDLKAFVAESAGRDATFTGRTEIWEIVLKMQQQPLFGYGYESFWLGDRLTALHSRWYFKPVQAHNGYIDLYLNLGFVGWVFFACVILSCYKKLRMLLISNHETTEPFSFVRLGMAFLGAYLVYNYTEAAFKTPHMLFFVFLLFAIKYRPPHVTMRQSAPAR